MKRQRQAGVLLLGLAAIFPIFSIPALADDSEKGVIPVAEMELIKEQLKKAVIVKGTIAESKIFTSGGHALLKFEEADVGVFIRKEDLAKNPGWALEALIGLEVYVAGQVKIYRDQLELVIVGPSQIAANPDGFELAKIPLPETQKKSGGSSAKKPAKVPGAIAPTQSDYPDLPLKLEEASVQGVAFYLVDSGMKIKGDPYGLPVDLISCHGIHGECGSHQGGGRRPDAGGIPQPERRQQRPDPGRARPGRGALRQVAVGLPADHRCRFRITGVQGRPVGRW